MTRKNTVEAARMDPFPAQMQEYRTQLRRGVIQLAYRGLMGYIMDLRTHVKNAHPEWLVPGNIYFGYMDMTYFSIIPDSLKARGLKVAVVFIHPECRFEVWLAGYNKKVQAQYWQLIRESGWDRYPTVADTKGEDAILEHVLAGDPDFSDLGALTRQIEDGVGQFIREVEAFLSTH